MSDKYPPVRLAADYREKLQRVPLRAWWSEEDEPWVEIWESGPSFPYRVALRYGLVEPVKTEELT